jgi:hypothetical protein
MGVSPEEEVSFLNPLAVGRVLEEIHSTTGKEAASEGHKFICPEVTRRPRNRDKFMVTPAVEIPISCDEPVPERLIEVLSLVRKSEHVFQSN